MGMIHVFLVLVTMIVHCNCWSLSGATPIVWQLGQRHEYQLTLQGVVGPESIAFDGAGEGPYTGVSDGRVVKWDRRTGQWTEFAMTLPHRFYFSSRTCLLACLVLVQDMHKLACFPR